MKTLYLWFQSLGEGWQFHHYLALWLHHGALWLQQLSANQRLVLMMGTVGLFFTCRSIAHFGYRQWRCLQRWRKRKAIPKRINLHLDRDEHRK
ncbi:hypothetical protein [Vibrio sp. OPT18]|uniref:hypothetical protein n=1 Tax=Vibrio sp. OPT18 TaxID=2778641 RepID=UPI00187EEF4C|nr:hypothetical protein [Vibrio sp. OPT18]MBE8574103.1 hypothetical protein [Vibrio sp. OPT18]